MWPTLSYYWDVTFVVKISHHSLLSFQYIVGENVMLFSCHDVISTVFLYSMTININVMILFSINIIAENAFKK